MPTASNLQHKHYENQCAIHGYHENHMFIQLKVDNPNFNREGTAAQRRVAAAEDGVRIGLTSLDDVCLEDAVRCRTLTLQGVPARLRGALRTAMRTGLELISERTSPLHELRGWKLFLLAPRMLLHRSAGQARIPPRNWHCDARHSHAESG